MKKNNKYNISFIAFIISICFGVATYKLFEYRSDYLDKNCYREVNGVVHDKMGEQKTHYKSTKVYTQFIMVIKDKDTGKYFDLEVTPTTYSTHSIGDDIHFSKIDKDILGEENDSKGYMIGIALLTGILCLISLSIAITGLFPEMPSTIHL